MSKCKINVDEGNDTSSYLTDEPPRWKSVQIPAPAGEEADGRLVFCVFTPSNGYDRGKQMHVPVSRVISVVEMG